MDTQDILYANEDREASDFVDVPRWIEQDIDAGTIAAIIQGGCDSGSYMPAVTYHTALRTMNERGEEVLEYLDYVYGEVPNIPDGIGWAGLACYFLSAAVEVWAYTVADEIAECLLEEDEAA